MTMLGLIPKPPGRIVTGEAIFKGRDLLTMSKKELREVRGGDIAMIFQDPMTSLNPVLTVGDQIAEAVLAHNPEGERRATRTDARSSCSRWSASRTPSSASTSTRTSSPAACASA